MFLSSLDSQTRHEMLGHLCRRFGHYEERT
jgi:hypothetical protein